MQDIRGLSVHFMCDLDGTIYQTCDVKERCQHATDSNSRRWRSGRPRSDVLARAVPAISSSIRSAYGRIASIRACARRSRAAATSSIAFVILRVFLTERTRRLMSWTDATARRDPLAARR